MNFFHTHVSAEAIARVTDVLRSGWLNEGDVTREFETALAGTLGLANPVALNSGTSALHLALVIAGVGPGDEVILPPQTFVATGHVVLLQGATPIFADIDPATGNLSVEGISAKITNRTKAVIPVHWGGLPCEMDAINALAARHGLTVIEDAAHALGARYRGRPVGTLSRFACFSFQAIKHLTTGDGGLLCCPDAADAHAVRVRRWFGIDRGKINRSPLGDRGVDIAVPGFKYHMNNVAAALGLGNLSDFPSRLTRRREIAANYTQHLQSFAGLTLLRVPAECEPAWWVFTVRVQRRMDFVRALGARGVPVSVVDLRIDQNSVFGGLQSELRGQAEFNESQIALPCHEALTDDDVGRVVQAIRAGW